MCVSACACVYISVSERDMDSLISIDGYGTAAGRNQFGGEGGDVGGSVGEVQPLQVARRTVVVVAVHIDNVLCRERERERVRVREKERKDRTRERQRMRQREEGERKRESDREGEREQTERECNLHSVRSPVSGETREMR